MPYLFEVLAQHPEEGRRIWLIVADGTAQAEGLVPEDYRPMNCRPIVHDARGPARLIGWAGPCRLAAAAA